MNAADSDEDHSDDIAYDVVGIFRHINLFNLRRTLLNETLSETYSKQTTMNFVYSAFLDFNVNGANTYSISTRPFTCATTLVKFYRQQCNEIWDLKIHVTMCMLRYDDFFWLLYTRTNALESYHWMHDLFSVFEYLFWIILYTFVLKKLLKIVYASLWWFVSVFLYCDRILTRLSLNESVFLLFE